jgi:hypothetical protein
MKGGEKMIGKQVAYVPLAVCVLLLGIVLVQAPTAPYMTLTLPNAPSGGYKPHDVVQLSAYLNGGGHNITFVALDWGDLTKMNLTIHVQNVTIAIYHTYLKSGKYNVLVNATTDLCYTPHTICQYFMQVLQIQIARSPSVTTLTVEPMIADPAKGQAFILTTQAKDPLTNIPISYANFSFYVIPLTGPSVPTQWTPIGKAQADINGIAIFSYYPLAENYYAFNSTFTGSADSERSSATLGLSNIATAPHAIPEFPTTFSYATLLILPICLGAFLKSRRNRKP